MPSFFYKKQNFIFLQAHLKAAFSNTPTKALERACKNQINLSFIDPL